MVNNAKDYNKCVSKPSLVSQKVFSKKFAAIHEIKTNLKLNKPIYEGFSVLDLSKCKMYGFHYNYIKRKFDAKLLFTDTKLKQMMFMKIFMKINICLILVTIQKIQNFMSLPL